MGSGVGSAVGRALTRPAGWACRTRTGRADPRRAWTRPCCSLRPARCPPPQNRVSPGAGGRALLLGHHGKPPPHPASPALPHQTLQQPLEPRALPQAAELAGERPVRVSPGPGGGRGSGSGPRGGRVRPGAVGPGGRLTWGARGARRSPRGAAAAAGGAGGPWRGRARELSAAATARAPRGPFMAAPGRGTARPRPAIPGRSGPPPQLSPRLGLPPPPPRWRPSADWGRGTSRPGGRRGRGPGTPRGNRTAKPRSLRGAGTEGPWDLGEDLGGLGDPGEGAAAGAPEAPGAPGWGEFVSGFSVGTAPLVPGRPERRDFVVGAGVAILSALKCRVQDHWVR